MGLISNGTTLLDAGSLDSGVATGSMTLIKTLTASSSSTLSFVDGASSVVFDGTYKEYIFKYIDMHPSGDNVNFTFNLSTDGGSNYNVTKTTTFWEAYHKEDGSDTSLAFADGRDLHQSTNFQQFNEGKTFSSFDAVVLLAEDDIEEETYESQREFLEYYL